MGLVGGAHAQRALEEARDRTEWVSFLSRAIELFDYSQTGMTPHGLADVCFSRLMVTGMQDRFQQQDLMEGRAVKLNSSQIDLFDRCAVSFGLRRKS